MKHSRSFPLRFFNFAWQMCQGLLILLHNASKTDARPWDGEKKEVFVFVALHQLDFGDPIFPFLMQLDACKLS